MDPEKTIMNFWQKFSEVDPPLKCLDVQMNMDISFIFCNIEN